MLSSMISLGSLTGIGWLEVSTAASLWGIGLLWLGCAITFEFVFGHYVARRSWSVLLRAYSIKPGEFWPAVLLVVAISPYLAAWVRGLV